MHAVDTFGMGPLEMLLLLVGLGGLRSFPKPAGAPVA
jgi:hypothetical protein